MEDFSKGNREVLRIFKKADFKAKIISENCMNYEIIFPVSVLFLESAIPTTSLRKGLDTIVDLRSFITYNTNSCDENMFSSFCHWSGVFAVFVNAFL